MQHRHCVPTQATSRRRYKPSSDSSDWDDFWEIVSSHCPRNDNQPIPQYEIMPESTSQTHRILAQSFLNRTRSAHPNLWHYDYQIRGTLEKAETELAERLDRASIRRTLQMNSLGPTQMLSVNNSSHAQLEMQEWQSTVEEVLQDILIEWDIESHTLNLIHPNNYILSRDGTVEFNLVIEHEDMWRKIRRSTKNPLTNSEIERWQAFTNKMSSCTRGQYGMWNDLMQDLEQVESSSRTFSREGEYHVVKGPAQGSEEFWTEVKGMRRLQKEVNGGQVVEERGEK